MVSKKLNFAILEYLTKLKQSSEGIDVAIQCLSESFGVDCNSPKDVSEFSYKPVELEAIFEAGVLSLKAKTHAEMNAEIMANPRFEPFMNKVSEKGYFKGCEEGSEEYANRLQKLIDKFKQKLEAEAPPAPAPVDEGLLAQAEELKKQGNDALVKEKDYQLAINFYTQAIDLYPEGPNTHIYYSNRAAARTHMEDFDSAIDDAQESINLAPDYTKAWSRMGFAHYNLNQYEEAADAYDKLLELEPGNSHAIEMKEKCMNELEKQSGINGGLGAGNMPDLSNLAGMLGGAGGGPGGLAGLMNNPQVMQAAQQMMQNPEMMSMAQNMMKDPSTMQKMMGMMGGGGGMPGMGGPGGAGVPSFGGFADEDAPAAAPAPADPGMAGMAEQFENSPQMQELKNDPEMAEFFADMEREGPMAAMKHMSNPKISNKVMSIMGSMMGGQN